MSTQDDEPRLPNDLKRDPIMLRLLRWLMEDKSRTLPQPDDETGVAELARAIGKSPEYTRALMEKVYGDQSSLDTLRILR